jgi:hypothetical protein
VGVRLRAADDLRAAIFANADPYRHAAEGLQRPPGSAATTPSRDADPYRHAAEGLQVKDVRERDRRRIVCFSSASAERDLKLRMGAIDRMRPVIERVNVVADATALREHSLYRRLISRDANGCFHLGKHKLECEAQCDGTFAPETSDDAMTAEQAALACKGLLRVEQTFRVFKQGVDLRPIYHRLNRRIRAHVTLRLLTYLIEHVVEVEASVPFDQVRKQLARVRAAELNFEQPTVWEPSRITPELKVISTKLKLPTPPRVLAPEKR